MFHVNKGPRPPKPASPPPLRANDPLPSWLVMDDAARRLGAPDAKTFLDDAPMSMKCAFKLICKLLMKHEYGPEGVWQDAA